MAEHEINPLALLYEFLSDHCVNDDFDTLKVLVRDKIPPRQLKMMINVTDVFKSLGDNGIISSNDVDYLKKLFTYMRKGMLVTKIEKYEADHIHENGGGSGAASINTSRLRSSREGEKMGTHEVNSLALLYVCLSDFCNNDDFKTLRFLARNDIPPRQLEKMKNATDVFINLEDIGIISSNDVNYLKRMFWCMGQKMPVTIIEQYEADHIHASAADTSSTKTARATSSDRSESVSTTGEPEQPPGRQKSATGVIDKDSEVNEEGPFKSKMNKGILIVGSEWGTQQGGLSTVNRHIGELAAKIKKVYATALEANQEDKDDAHSKGIELLLPSQAAAHGMPDMIWLKHYSSVHFPSIEGKDIDIIIGHLPITSTAAFNIRDQWFKSKKVILFNHVIPEDIGVHKPSWSPEKVQEKENALCEEASKAFVVFSVGPRMYSHFENKYRQYPSLRHELFLPMPDEKFFQITMKKPSADCKVQILTFGRVNGVANLKGYDLVARALSKVAADYKKFRPNEDAPVWTIRGIPEGEGEQSKKYIEEHVTCGDLQCNLYPYGSQDQIRDDLQQSHICLMPSRSEPFGMVGLEAIAAGIPVLLTKNSGLAKFLIKYIDRDRANAVILDVGVNDQQREEDIEKWSVRIQQVLNDFEGAFKRAQEMKKLLLNCDEIKKTQKRFKELCSD